MDAIMKAKLLPASRRARRKPWKTDGTKADFNFTINPYQ